MSDQATLLQNLAGALRAGTSRARYYVLDAEGKLPPEVDQHGRANARFFVSKASAERTAHLAGGTLQVHDLNEL